MGLGILRFLLSLMVIDQHYGGYRDYILPQLLAKIGVSHLAPIGEGAFAVTGFFVLSGYLIAHVLSNRHQLFAPGPWNPWRFYLERALRIYPTYLLILLLSIPAYILLGNTPHFGIGDWISNVLLINLGAGLLGMDLSANYGLTVGTHLLLPQAWTITLDLCFYLIAPFILRYKILRRGMLILGTLSFGCAQAQITSTPAWFIAFYASGWIYWIAFLWGAEIRLTAKSVPGLWSLLAAAYILYAAYLPVGLPPVLLQVLAIPAFGLIIAHLGTHGRPSRLDRFLGELTYALYLLQITVWMLIQHVFPAAPYLPALFSTFALAIFISIFFERPLDRHRHLWAKHITQYLQKDITRPVESTVTAFLSLGLLTLLALTIEYHWTALSSERSATCHNGICRFTLPPSRVSILHLQLPVRISALGINLQSCTPSQKISAPPPTCIPDRNQQAVLGIFHLHDRYIIGINSYRVVSATGPLHALTIKSPSFPLPRYRQWMTRP